MFDSFLSFFPFSFECASWSFWSSLDVWFYDWWCYIESEWESMNLYMMRSTVASDKLHVWWPNQSSWSTLVLSLLLINHLYHIAPIIHRIINSIFINTEKLNAPLQNYLSNTKLWNLFIFVSALLFTKGMSYIKYWWSGIMFFGHEKHQCVWVRK